MKYLKDLFVKYYDVISYLIFGGLTTAVHYVFYLPCVYLFEMSSALSTAIAWTAAVIFAYVTNKPFVFKSHDWSIKTVIPEFGKFIASRIGSGILNVLLMGLTVDIWKWHELAMMVIVSILVVIINYATSKLLVFAKKK